MRSNIGNQNDNSLLFTIKEESKEEIRRVGKSKGLQKAGNMITTKNIQCATKIRLSSVRITVGITGITGIAVCAVAELQKSIY